MLWWVPCSYSITPKRSHYVFWLENKIFSFTCLADQQISEHFFEQQHLHRSVSHSVMHFLERAAPAARSQSGIQTLLSDGALSESLIQFRNSFLHFDPKLITYSSRYSFRKLSFLVYLAYLQRKIFRSSNVYSVVSWWRCMRLSWEMIKDWD